MPENRKLGIFFAAFAFVGLLQAGLTELGNDEAYYWVFSQNLDWGYFDHPPMVAILIALGYALFGNELGVRLMTIVLMSLSVYLVYKMLPRKKDSTSGNKVFFLLIASSPLITIYSFVTTPDVPLIFFSVLFIYVYKQFVENNSRLNALWMGLVMAALAYSKYHGALVVFFVVLSNPKILLRPKIYVAGLLTAVLLIPHLLWQWQHDFATFEYHFFSRNENFNWEALLMYPVNVLLILNPFVAPVLFYRLPKLKSENSFERTLKFLFWGFIIFFGFSAFKSHVEPHWIAIVIIPTIYFLYKIYSEKRVKYFYITSIITAVLLVVARVLLMLPLDLKTEFHGGKQWAKDIEIMANNTPVAFYNTFRSPSKYKFYTGKDAFGYNSIYYRPTQYDFWDYENKYNDKKVLVVFNYTPPGVLKYTTSNGSEIRYKVFENFTFFDKLKIEFPDTIEVLKANERATMEVIVENTYDWDVATIGDEKLAMDVVFKKDTRVKGAFAVHCKLPDVLKAKQRYTIPVSFTPKVDAAGYLMTFCFRTPTFVPMINGKLKEVEVK